MTGVCWSGAWAWRGRAGSCVHPAPRDGFTDSWVGAGLGVYLGDSDGAGCRQAVLPWALRTSGLQGHLASTPGRTDWGSAGAGASPPGSIGWQLDPEFVSPWGAQPPRLRWCFPEEAAFQKAPWLCLEQRSSVSDDFFLV